MVTRRSCLGIVAFVALVPGTAALADAPKASARDDPLKGKSAGYRAG